MAFPIHRANYRTLDPDWIGQVFVADIDRTYLATRFSSLRGMARIPFETAQDKRDIEGMARLFREIRHGPGAESRETPLYFVSASPRQLRAVIEKKMALDGIGFDGTTFKDWSGVVRRMRFKRLREQIGFKLTALVANRAELPAGAEEFLIGDDLENDPVTYALYADLLARRIPSSDAARILAMNGVLPGDARAIVDDLRRLEAGRGVRQVLIRLERYAHPDDLFDFAPSVLGCAGAFQMVVALWKLGCVAPPGIGRVASDLVHRGVDPAVLAERLRDLVRRAVIDPEEGARIAEDLYARELLAEIVEVGEPEPRWQDAWGRSPHRVWTPARYVGE